MSKYKMAKYYSMDLNKLDDPLQSSEFLLSDYAFTYKMRVLLSMPEEAVEYYINMRILESRLENSGQPLLARVVRWRSFYTLPGDEIEDALQWTNGFISAEIAICRVVQRERYLIEEANALSKSVATSSGSTNTTEEKTALGRYEIELERLNNQYWSLLGETTELEGEKPAGVFGKAFDTLREDPDWYVCPWLRHNCADRGGCCGRSCGCCEDPARGHCTSQCGCCVRTQGRIDVDDATGHEEDFRFVDYAASTPRYMARVNRAYIWGVSFIEEQGLGGYIEDAVDIR